MNVEWIKAPDVAILGNKIIKSLQMDWLEPRQIHYYRSRGSKARAYARIWGLSKIWQLALDEKPTYIIEVLSEKFDKLKDSQKDEVIIHELTHIPKNFSGSLMPHIRKGKRNFHKKVKMYLDSYRR